MCGEEYEKGRSDKEAMAETRQYFGENIKAEDCEVVCDACWEEIHPRKHPAQHLRALIEQAINQDRFGREMLG
jgi:hypothetical protein